jgi:HPt (histidine-containing phosphotransfer) domain-containing protein
MVEVFLSEYPYFLEQIRTTIAEDDGLILASAARTIKVSVSNFVAPEVFEAAAALEKIGMHGDLSPASAALLRLEQALGRLEPALSDLKQLAG